jgi:hypothetical protein
MDFKQLSNLTYLSEFNMSPCALKFYNGQFKNLFYASVVQNIFNSFKCNKQVAKN